jgi:histone deacetylase 6
VVIAAKKALAAGTRRILIVDFDLHHGQGTQRAFYDDPRVLYMSVHRYEEGRFWPHLRESNFDWVGEGAGLGFNVNLPLNVVGCGPTEYLAVFNRLFLPIATEYRPDLVIVSAGKFLCSTSQNVSSKITCSNNNFFPAALLWIRIRMGPH